MDGSGEKYTSKIIYRRVVNDAVQYLLNTERWVWLPASMCPPDLVETFENDPRYPAESISVTSIDDGTGNLVKLARNLRAMYKTNSGVSSSQEEALFDDEDHESQDIAESLEHRAAKFSEFTKKMMAPASAASLIGRRVEDSLVYYLVKIDTYTWLSENCFPEEQIDEYFRTIEVQPGSGSGECTSSSSSLSSSMVHRQASFLDLTESRESFPDSDSDPQRFYVLEIKASPSCEDLRKSKIIEKRTINNRTQYLFHTERWIWLEDYLCDPIDIKNFERQETPPDTPNVVRTRPQHHKLTIPDNDQPCTATGIFASAKKYTCADLLEKEPNILQATASKMNLQTEADQSEKTDFAIEDPITVSRIMEKRWFNGSVQYLVNIETYNWLDESFYDGTMILDFLMNTLLKKIEDDRFAKEGRVDPEDNSLAVLYRAEAERRARREQIEELAEEEPSMDSYNAYDEYNAREEASVLAETSNERIFQIENIDDSEDMEGIENYKS